jgi:hypothetical protein
LFLPLPPAPLPVIFAKFLFASQSSFPHPRVAIYLPSYLLYLPVPSVQYHTASHSFLLHCPYQTSATYSKLPYAFYKSNLSKKFISK